MAIHVLVQRWTKGQRAFGRYVGTRASQYHIFFLFLCPPLRLLTWCEMRTELFEGKHFTQEELRIKGSLGSAAGKASEGGKWADKSNAAGQNKSARVAPAEVSSSVP